jgi:diketogulonate reductase-like aldo/keto reductase
MESLYDQKLTRSLAVSNVSLDQLRSLFDTSRVKPTFVQNRCFSVNGWDFEIRKFCRENKIHYQGFSLLTANSEALRTPLVAKLSQKYGATIPQIIFRFTQQLSMIPLTGTSSPSHMAEDLTCQKFTLNENELTDIEKVML